MNTDKLKAQYTSDIQDYNLEQLIEEFGMTSENVGMLKYLHRYEGSTEQLYYNALIKEFKRRGMDIY